MNGILFQNTVNTIIIVIGILFALFLTDKGITKKLNEIDTKQNQIIMLLSKDYPEFKVHVKEKE